MLSPPAFRYVPLVRYHYQVNAIYIEYNYIPTKRIQAPQHGTRKWAQKRADSFPAEVTVHYNSVDPGESYLVQTSKAVVYLLVTISCLVLLIGIGIFVII